MAVGNVSDAAAREKFPDKVRATLRGNDGYAFTAPVGSFRANHFGLYDLHGNAVEWCLDWYGPYPGAPAVAFPQEGKASDAAKFATDLTIQLFGLAPAQDQVVTDPIGPQTGELRVLRGGSWNGEPKTARSSHRYAGAPNEPVFNRGFRVVRVP